MPTLNWIGKEKVINHHQDVPFKILEPQYTFTNGKETKGANSENKIIHGDNLEALKSLLPEYEGKINCIYIDPPYNTGNEEWKYNDNVNSPTIKKWLGKAVGKESEDLSRHDKWLCMMYPRLKLLHKLLAKESVIFISIDDNEQASLKLVMDEIFGSNSFVTTLHVEMSSVQGQKVKFAKQGSIVKNGEHILIYKKSGKKNIAKKILYNLQDYDTHYSIYLKKIDENNYLEIPLSQFIINENKDIINHLLSIGLAKKSKNKISLSNKNIAKAYSISDIFKEFIHKNAERIVADDKVSSLSGLENLDLKKGEVKLVKKESRNYLLTINSNNNIRQRLILNEKIHKANDYYNTHGITTIRGDWWSGYYKDMGNVAKEGNTKFDNAKKPKRLIRDILYMTTDKNDIILDSFAGSGTTAHAVIDLNKEDNGNRKFILVEMEDYANEITSNRIKNVINDSKSGDFTYYELGGSLFLDNGFLNESVGLDKIHQYVWYSETKEPYKKEEENYLLGAKNDTAYYFYYQKDSITTLDESFLRSIKTKANQYIIYADNCLLPQTIIDKYNIVFKKIPRDITRF
ncbi:site-specific DNA-methyltransferase [uncultured Polaribacter sp.]|uniref:site-specific DNA-methyltransferase n=1 Tax=uncultured Polaribacter sp. TaxID=174711 RepID=UPI00262667DA|nr:site-specific DNA-methyltransferase [uncultured Polaribacter sp.]